uniref:Uncharacterized protein n=1 Tax=Mucochytrium quahogii TaxID=96639 RepID=A0A7S2WA16_9STRA|mmetsp:Transcript_30802/g.49342  ORF Transcript_30802/g.49342 Transcript_30802/m.49342 type:complete len:258 (-) Transcript_30802:1162-1935(-)
MHSSKRLCESTLHTESWRFLDERLEAINARNKKSSKGSPNCEIDDLVRICDQAINHFELRQKTNALEKEVEGAHEDQEEAEIEQTEDIKQGKAREGWRFSLKRNSLLESKLNNEEEEDVFSEDADNLGNNTATPSVITWQPLRRVELSKRVPDCLLTEEEIAEQKVNQQKRNAARSILRHDVDKNVQSTYGTAWYMPPDKWQKKPEASEPTRQETPPARQSRISQVQNVNLTDLYITKEYKTYIKSTPGSRMPHYLT